MSRYIDAEWLKTFFEADRGKDRHTPIDSLLALIDEAPSADVVERKRGTYRLSEYDDEWYCHYQICNECGAKWMCSNTNFCPNCGADMRGEK